MAVLGPVHVVSHTAEKAIKEHRPDFSSDEDEAAFKEYFAEMPFVALPFERREDKDALSGMFEVRLGSRPSRGGGFPTSFAAAPRSRASQRW